MLIHRKNLYAPCSRRCTGRHEAQSREPVNKVKKKLSVLKLIPETYCGVWLCKQQPMLFNRRIIEHLSLCSGRGVVEQ
jgi:hypothetical protein